MTDNSVFKETFKEEMAEKMVEIFKENVYIDGEPLNEILDSDQKQEISIEAPSDETNTSKCEHCESFDCDGGCAELGGYVR